MHQPLGPGHIEGMSTQTSAQKSSTEPLVIERPEPFIKPGQMFLAHDQFVCDNVGCAGASAIYTGRTIGGARLSKVRVADVTDWASYDLGPMRCECGALEARLNDKGRLEIVKVADLPAVEQTGATQ